MPLIPVYKVCSVSSDRVLSAIGSYLQILGVGEKGNGNILYYCGSLFDSPDKQLKEKFLLPGSRIFVR